jgi:anti-sigma factor RsiW
MLSEGESSELRKHIASCRACRDVLTDAEKFDKELGAAFGAIQPPSDFAARTARAVGEAEIERVSVKPIVWVTAAAAACLVLAFGLNAILPDGSGRRRRAPEIVRAGDPSGAVAVGPAFSIGRDGRLSAYRGRTSVSTVWNIREGAPELIVDAFPGAD